MEGEIKRLCGEDEWDGAIELIQRMIRTQPEDAKFLVDEEEYYLKPVREHSLEEVNNMLEEVKAKLQTEIRVAKYEVDARYNDVVEEVQSYMNELDEIRQRFKKMPKEDDEEEKKDEDDQAAANAGGDGD